MLRSRPARWRTRAEETRRRPGFSGIGSFGLLASLGIGLEAQAKAQTAFETPIVVVGEPVRPLGPPERAIRGDDIPFYGSGTIGELIDEIAAEGGAGASEAEILVDGRLIANVGSISDFPVEAVERIDVLPSGAAGRLGGSRTGRAYNVILRPSTRVLAVRAGGRVATDGGWKEVSGDAGFTAIAKPRRLNITVDGAGSGSLLESERDVIQPQEAQAGRAQSRSLLPERRRIGAGLVASDEFAPWLRGTLNAKVGRQSQMSRLGVAATGGRLDQFRRLENQSVDVFVEADIGQWRATLGGAYTNRMRTVNTDPDGGRRRYSRTHLDTRMIELSANGPLFTLPAGPLRLTAAVGARREAIFTNADGSTSRMRQFERDARLAIDVPISSADGFLAPLGNLSIGAELRRGRVSDQGRSSSTTLTTQWQPFESLRLFGSISRGRAPLSLSLLADPIVVTPGERFFDPLTGTSPDVSAVTGGNPDLSPSTTREQRLSIQFKPIKRLELDLSADYTRTDSRNIPSILPAASAIAMAVFPERFVRDDGGTLILVDLRTVNFARQCEEQLRYGFNLTLPLAALRSAKREDRPGGRFQLSASHTILLSSQLVIRQGMAPINLLSAESVAFGGAMRPRHRFDFSFGYAERGLGIRFSGESRSESFLDASAPGSTDTLRFSPLFTMGLRAFVEGSRIAPTLPWLKGARLSLAVVNIGNARARVRDDLGSTPLAFQPVYNDPLGRTIELEFRKAL